MCMCTLLLQDLLQSYMFLGGAYCEVGHWGGEGGGREGEKRERERRREREKEGERERENRAMNDVSRTR